MTGKTFVDTNVLIYAHDLDAGPRRWRAAECLTELWNTRTGRLSTQVLQEFYVNVTQKIKVPLSRSAAREVVRNYTSWVESPITPATVVRASEIGEIWNISFWDGMILAAAEQDQAFQLLSEDMNHGQLIAGVKIVNPFLEDS
jgi:predicted nucleic acid-binding protein